MNKANEYETDNPLFTRSPRIVRVMPSGEVEIEAAPNIGQKPEINWLSVLLPSFGMIMIMAAMVWLLPPVFSGNTTTYSPLMFVFSCLVTIIGVVTSIVNYRRQTIRFRKKESLRIEKYDAYLKERCEYIEKKVNEQRTIQNDLYVSPAQCLDIVTDRSQRLWERMPDDDDFMSLRIGLGSLPFAMKIKTPKAGISLEEDEYLYIPQKIASEYEQVSDVPIVCDLMHDHSCGIVGSYDHTSSLARSMIIQAATAHGYDELRIIGVFSDEHKDDWKWLRFLQHVFDRAHMMRYLSFGKYQSGELLRTLEDELKFRMDAIRESDPDDIRQKIPYYLILTDDISLLTEHPFMKTILDRGNVPGVGFIVISDSISGIYRSTAQIIRMGVHESSFYIRNGISGEISFIPDRSDIVMCDRLARAMAPIRLSSPEGSNGKLPDQVTFMNGYGINRPNDLDLADLWENVRPEESMLVPLGVDPAGDTFYFDINENAHGPHGLVAGTTGSGKSEMIQSWILSMAIQFSPQDVSFVLIDFKGTGLIQPFIDLPHLAGKISDIDTDIGRNLIALRAELQRRKRLFDKAGTNNIRGYLKLYRAGEVKEPLSYLFVIIDEYAEFRSVFPDFTAEINSLFRTGRALGVHIILLTQNPSGVISDESVSNVRFRWCLKVANAAASSEILGGHPDAALISVPGRAYVRVGEDEIFEQIQSFYSGAPYHPNSQRKRIKINRIDISGRRYSLTVGDQSFEYGREADAIIKYICDYTKSNQIAPAKRIWNDQLPNPIFLQNISDIKDERGDLLPAVGQLDDPENQKQYAFRLPLSTEGHVVIHGGPGSGKTTFLQTLIMSLCIGYTPDEVNIYVMDFGSWGMSVFSDFPHIGGVANSNEDAQISDMAAAISDILDERKRLFAREDVRVGSIQSYNRSGREILPYVVLVVDNFTPVLQVFPQLESFFEKLTREGGSYGVYLVATCGTSAGLGFRLQQNIRTKVALQMTDNADYVTILGRTGGVLPKNLPGRGLYRDGKVMEFQTALPSDSIDEAERASLIREAARKQKEEWHGERPQNLKTIPKVISYGSIPADDGFILGLSTPDISPVTISQEIPHTLLISGTSGSGKTNLMRLLILQMNKCPGSKMIVYGKESEYRDILKQDDIVTEHGEEIDEYLSSLSEELQKRKDKKDQADPVSFNPIFILLDGFKKCADCISKDSINRLNAIAHLGSGLGIMLVISDRTEELNSLKDNFLVLGRMSDEQVIILGGSPSDHQIISDCIPPKDRHSFFEEYEGMLISKDKMIKLRLMKADKGD